MNRKNDNAIIDRVVYKMYSLNLNQVYIGATASPTTRFQTYDSSYNNYIIANKGRPKAYFKLYEAGNVQFEILESKCCNRTDIEKLETEYIKQFDDVCLNKYKRHFTDDDAASSKRLLQTRSSTNYYKRNKTEILEKRRNKYQQQLEEKKSSLEHALDVLATHEDLKKVICELILTKPNLLYNVCCDLLI